MEIARQYILTQMVGESRWILWESGGFTARYKYILHAGDDPVALVKRLFEVPKREEADHGRTEMGGLSAGGC